LENAAFKNLQVVEVCFLRSAARGRSLIALCVHVEPVRHCQTKGPRETTIIRKGRKICKRNQSWNCTKWELYSASVFAPFRDH